MLGNSKIRASLHLNFLNCRYQSICFTAFLLLLKSHNAKFMKIFKASSIEYIFMIHSFEFMTPNFGFCLPLTPLLKMFLSPTECLVSSYQSIGTLHAKKWKQILLPLWREIKKVAKPRKLLYQMS
jgi:hypothetical protein